MGLNDGNGRNSSGGSVVVHESDCFAGVLVRNQESDHRYAHMKGTGSDADAEPRC